MRTTIVMAVCFSLAFAGCDKKTEKPSGPTEAEVYALHKAAGTVQVENLGAVLELASKEKALSVDDLLKPVVRLSVSDIVVNKKKEEHSGNARVILLNQVMTKSTHPKLFGAADAYRRIMNLHLPALPTSFHPGSFNEVFVRSATFIGEAPSSNADKEYFEGYCAMLEEFVSLKYLLLLRTIAIELPQETEPGVYTPGVYGGQLMVFDLAKRELLGVLPVMTSNKEGNKVGGVDFDLSWEVESQISLVLATAQGQTRQAKPVIPTAP